MTAWLSDGDLLPHSLRFQSETDNRIVEKSIKIKYVITWGLGAFNANVSNTGTRRTSDSVVGPSLSVVNHHTNIRISLKFTLCTIEMDRMKINGLGHLGSYRYKKVNCFCTIHKSIDEGYVARLLGEIQNIYIVHLYRVPYVCHSSTSRPSASSRFPVSVLPQKSIDP